MIDWWLIEKSLNHSLNEDEQKIFSTWLNESSIHRAWYEKVKSYQEASTKDYPYTDWRKSFEQQLKAKQETSKRRFLYWSSIAALFVIALGSGIWLFYRTPKSVLPNDKSTFQATVYQTPDRHQIQLTLASGEIIHLSSKMPSDTTLKIDGVEVARHPGELIYQESQQNTDLLSAPINQIKVPRGAEFCLTLSDGTRIWLNSSTTLSYPVTFSQNKREVTLQGEAYFQINRNEQQPFIVQTEGMKVTVLGTEFNLNTRKKEQIQTALVNGKVSIETSNGKHVTLNPGEIATTNGITGKIQTAKGNLLQHISWREGKFYFENASIEEIMNELMLWYDVQVTFQQEQLRYEKFSGYLLRGETIGSILKKIEQTTYVHFQITGRQIIVK